MSCTVSSKAPIASACTYNSRHQHARIACGVDLHRAPAASMYTNLPRRHTDVAASYVEVATTAPGVPPQVVRTVGAMIGPSRARRCCGRGRGRAYTHHRCCCGRTCGRLSSCLCVCLRTAFVVVGRYCGWPLLSWVPIACCHCGTARGGMGTCGPPGRAYGLWLEAVAPQSTGKGTVGATTCPSRAL